MDYQTLENLEIQLHEEGSAMRPRAEGSEDRRLARAFGHVRRSGLVSLCSLAAGLLLAGLPTSASAQIEEPLELVLRVQEPELVDRQGDLAWVSVPLPAGRLTTTDRLLLEDDQGRELPLQVEVLGRWWHLDYSIAWLGLEFPVTLPKGGEVRVRLRERRPREPEIAGDLSGKLELQQSERELVVDTGLIQARIRRGSTLPFAEVRLDTDRDGNYLERERVISSSEEAGVELIDAKGSVYRAAEGLESIEIERAGPLHAIVRLTGTHRAVADDPGVPELLGFVARLHFYRGDSVVRVEWTLRNAPLENPWGAVPFRSYRMIVPGDLGEDSLDYYFEADQYQGLLPPAVARLARSRSAVALLQYGPPQPRPAGAKDEGAGRSGYYIAKLAGNPSIVHAGDRASSLLLAAGRRLGFGAGLRDLWQNYPKLLGWGAEGRLEIGLWPDSGDPEKPHTLEDQTQKSHEIWFHFFERRGEAGEVLAREAKKLAPLERQVRGTAPLDRIVASRAWGDLGDLAQVPPAAKLATLRFATRLLAAHRQRLLSPQGSGWQYYGSADPLGRSDRKDLEPRFPLFGAWLQTGSPFFFELSALRARHARDLRPFHLDGFRASDLEPDAEPVVGGQLGRRFGRDQLSPEVADLQEKLPASQRPYYGNVAYGEDLEEVELLVQHWWLTGERASLEAAIAIGQQILTWKEVRPLSRAEREGSEGAATSAKEEGATESGPSEPEREAAESEPSEPEREATEPGGGESGAAPAGASEAQAESPSTDESAEGEANAAEEAVPLEPRRAGWILRALGFLYQATGDDAYLEGALRLTTRLRAMQDPRLGFFGEVRGVSHLGGEGEPSTENWSAGVLARGLAFIHRLTGSAEIRDMLEGLVSFWVEEAWAPEAARGEGAFRIETLTEAPSPAHYRGLPREEWLLPGLTGGYRATGRIELREKLFAVLLRLYQGWPGIQPAILVDWFQAPLVERSRYEEIRIRPDLDRPQRSIADLQVEASAGGVVLSWTAPADPQGRQATAYQVKMARAPIVARVRLEERESSEAVPFWSLPNRFEPLPPPARPGEPERLSLDLDLEPGVYFFSVRWEDRRGRWSPIAESARVEIPR